MVALHEAGRDQATEGVTYKYDWQPRVSAAGGLVNRGEFVDQVIDGFEQGSISLGESMALEVGCEDVRSFRHQSFGDMPVTSCVLGDSMSDQRREPGLGWGPTVNDNAATTAPELD
jgi:hypothetical protein